MKKFFVFLSGVMLLLVAACDLQPKIMSLPDSVGEFISARYPALLADPETQPEIYNSAATDYGVYASPELYGSVDDDDYVVYASVDDYIIPPQGDAALYGDVPESVSSVEYGEPIADAAVAAAGEDYLQVPMYGATTTVTQEKEITVAAGDTLYSLAQRYNTTTEKLARMNNLAAPYSLAVGQKLKVPYETESVVAAPIVVPARKAHAVGTQTTTRVQLQEITVAAGDTLYSLSRKYSVPVNDLAVMNNLSAPFTLSVGQKLKVPNLDSAAVRVASSATSASPTTTVAASSSAGGKASTATQTAKPKEKISSDPSKKLPTIGARSSSKFSWPVRGTILSHYGAKSGGLFNDGINIGASRGTAVKAAENGVVAYAGNEVKGMGNLIIIQHSGGWMTVYAHMDSMNVRRGTRVSVGQKIGTVGATGKVDRPQLHFEIRKGTKAYNPSSYLKK